MAKDMQDVFQEVASCPANPFHALVLFSGGKDSTYMVSRLKWEHPLLKLLLFTVDNTFMSPIALENIKFTVEKLGLDHVVYRPPTKLYEKMYRHAFLNLNKKGCSGTVDQFDGDLFHDIARNWASRHGIPLIVSGCSRTQVQRILGFENFESPDSLEGRDRTEVAGIVLGDVFTEEEMTYWWKGSSASFKSRVIFPFYVWNPEESEIINQIQNQGLVRPEASNPLLTNSQLVPLMAMVDMVQFGYSSFEPEFSQMVRAGKADAELWKNVFELSEYAAKTGRFVSGSVDLVLKRLNLSRQQLGLPR